MLATVAASSPPSSAALLPPTPPALASFELASACAFARSPENYIFGGKIHGGKSD